MLLGLGGDGHLLSVFPGSRGVRLDRVGARGPGADPHRAARRAGHAATRRSVRVARARSWSSSLGAAKADIVAPASFRGPAGRARRGRASWPASATGATWIARRGRPPPRLPRMTGAATASRHPARDGPTTATPSATSGWRLAGDVRLPARHTPTRTSGAGSARSWCSKHETWVADGAGRARRRADGRCPTTWSSSCTSRPTITGTGIGSRLLALAKERRPAGLELYCFRSMTRARRFYERNGFVAVAFGDGSGQRGAPAGRAVRVAAGLSDAPSRVRARTSSPDGTPIAVFTTAGERAARSSSSTARPPTTRRSGSSARCWRERYAVHAIDRRGRGGSGDTDALRHRARVRGRRGRRRGGREPTAGRRSRSSAIRTAAGARSARRCRTGRHRGGGLLRGRADAARRAATATRRCRRARARLEAAGDRTSLLETFLRGSSAWTTRRSPPTAPTRSGRGGSRRRTRSPRARGGGAPRPPLARGARRGPPAGAPDARRRQQAGVRARDRGARRPAAERHDRRHRRARGTPPTTPIPTR